VFYCNKNEIYYFTKKNRKKISNVKKLGKTTQYGTKDMSPTVDICYCDESNNSDLHIIVRYYILSSLNKNNKKYEQAKITDCNHVEYYKLKDAPFFNEKDEYR